MSHEGPIVVPAPAGGMSARSAPRALTPGLAAAACAVAWACGTTDVPVLSLTAGGDAGADGAPSLPPALGTRAEYCAGSGPPVLVDSPADGGSITTCPDRLAQGAFRYALCTCGGYVNDHALVTDSFDGSKAPYDAATAGSAGSVGTNGDLHPTGPMRIGGSLWASDGMDITTAAVEVAGDLHAQGELRPGGALDVQGDAWLAGGIQASGDVTVAGTMHVAAGPIDVAGARNFGTPDMAAFPYAPACDCSPSDFVDVAGIVATYQADNDDAALNIDPTMLENVQTPATISLGCGRVFFTRIGAGQAAIHLTVQQRVAIFVGGDISASDFDIDVPVGSELDLFVKGSVTVRGAFTVGDPSNPARARTYVGGPTINLQSAATLSGNVYAPQATLTLGAAAPATLYGSVFASSLSASSDLTIHYDQAILTPSTPGCAPPVTCSTCSDCAGQACNSHTCGACVDSTGCCAPLVCGAGGVCVASGAVP
jgi:hypothetical protein